MTKRQENIGVTAEGYNSGIVKEEFLANFEAFTAKASTLKKGEYKGIEITKKWFPDYAEMESFIRTKHEEMKPFLFGLTARFPEYFNYTDTYGLDILTVK